MDPDPPVLRILRGAVCGALCRDGRELRLAAACGFAGPAVAYAPMRPDAAAEQLARELGAVFVLDGPQVLPAFAPEAAVLLLRQQGPLRISGRPIMGAPVSSAGMEEAELCRLATCLHAGGTRTLGLGMSLGDLCMDEGFYPAVFAQLAAAAARLREKSGLTVRIFDLGGASASAVGRTARGRIFRLRRALRAQTCALPEALQGCSCHESRAVPAAAAACWSAACWRSSRGRPQCWTSARRSACGWKSAAHITRPPRSAPPDARPFCSS
ncbi:MAG: hypothetical protein ACLT1T_05500 [Oscillospiraceae bacterium]